MSTGSERFHEVLRELGELHDLKQADYGTDEDPFANVRATGDFGIEPWVGSVIRLNDKVQRLKSMVKNGNLKNEPAEDSLRDIAVYAVIGLVLYEEARARSGNNSNIQIKRQCVANGKPCHDVCYCDLVKVFG